MTTGPLQLVVIGFDQLDRFHGQILTELQEVRGRDVIRLLDLLFLAKDEAGQLTALDLSDLPEEERARSGSLLGTLIGLDLAGDEPSADGTVPEDSETGLSSEEVRQLAELLEPGTAAALLLVEHRWAARLAAAMRDAGGRLLAQGLLIPDARVAMGEALSDIAEAAVAATTIEDSAIRSAAVADVVGVLVGAGVLEDTAALDAVDALVAAGLIDPAVVDAAAREAPAVLATGPSGNGGDGG